MLAMHPCQTVASTPRLEPMQPAKDALDEKRYAFRPFRNGRKKVVEKRCAQPGFPKAPGSICRVAGCFPSVSER